ncbi:MAG: two-component system, OmpR family, phosphate regulon response regulator PhoB [Actinomycetota bacterium]|jgi:DNA-binding response OmpR family regulator|nr:two-component system, OmpR family, phosphate regulon response regulator PhoB [Actinomycetota bacterium]
MSLPTPEEIARILVCEDDRPTLELLCDHLTADRFGVLAAPTAEDAMRLCIYDDPDLLLLDLNLPDASGLELLREIRNPDRSVNRVNPALGVIIVSGRGTERDRIRGLGQGADDYVQKPYSYGELLARINAVLRRKARTHPVIRAGEIEINSIERTVKVAGRPVPLSVKEFGLLSLLATEPTRVFSKEELLQEVWGYRSMNHTRTLEAHCSRLRRKLDPDGGKYVVNCWGVGYRLVGP